MKHCVKSGPKSLVNKVCGLASLALLLAAPAPELQAQDLNTFYVTPRLIYSYQNGDMSSSKWNGGGPFRAGVLGGDDTDKNLGFGLALGSDLSYTTGYPVRVELEYAYRSEGEFSKGKAFSANGNSYQASQRFNVKAHSLMGNVFYDFFTDSDFTPYIGGGLGVAYLKTEYRTSAARNGATGSASLSNTDWNLAWNLGGGVTMGLSDTVTLDLGYRYVDLGKGDAGSFNIHSLTYSGSPSVDYTAHEISVGLRFSGFDF